MPASGGNNGGFQNPGTLPATHNTPADLPKTLYVEGVAGSGSRGDIELELSYAAEGNACTDEVTLTVVALNLTAQDLDGEVAEKDEEDPAAYVHYNVDNDNEGCLIFLEAIRNACVEHPTWNETTFQQQAVVHEVGHTFGLGHTADTIMNPSLPVPISQERFSDADIDTIRSRTSSPGN